MALSYYDVNSLPRGMRDMHFIVGGQDTPLTRGVRVDARRLIGTAIRQCGLKLGGYQLVTPCGAMKLTSLSSFLTSA